MKRLFLLCFVCSTAIGVHAQVKKKPVTAPKPVGATAVAMKTADDSVSYAIGIRVADFFKQQNVKYPNSALVNKAIQDVLKGGSLLLDEQQCNNAIMAYVNKGEMERVKQNAVAAEGNKKIGKTFLDNNKTKPGVVELPSGLQYQVLATGTGPRPTITDKVKCNYKGSMLDGTVFDSSDQHGGALELSVDRVIAGWTEALQLMAVGSKWRLFVPSNLGYGDVQPPGSSIKPGSTLIFDIELVEIVH
jgi:FKBP-type peptidyl-prolyl cis-trans isomerase FklB